MAFPALHGRIKAKDGFTGVECAKLTWGDLADALCFP